MTNPSIARFPLVPAVGLACTLLTVGALRPADAQPATPTSGCIRCHASLADPALSSPVKAFQDDVHQARGFSCVDCHGGDPNTDDKAAAKRPASGYRGRPQGMAIIQTCARCHSDAEFMRRYAPKQRVDQASEYATSVHGKRLATGDTHVATCVSCHGNHGIRLVSDAKSPAFPLNVADTCARCHGNAEYMKGYIEAGTQLPTDQRAEYQKSVHYEALTRKNDMSAPTCNDCHGNHGAAPPGVGSVANVCGTCHAVFQMRYQTSKHRDFFECVQCHSNHAVLAPSDDMLGQTPPAVCAECHGEGDPGYVAAGRMREDLARLERSIDGASTLVERVANAGLEMSDQELALGEARNKLTLARTEVHAFNPDSLDKVVGEGLQITNQVEKAGTQGEAELRFRRTGLAGSLVAILFVVVALGLKIRQLDRAAGVSKG